MNLNIWRDFQICISLPLSVVEIFWRYFLTATDCPSLHIYSNYVGLLKSLSFPCIKNESFFFSVFTCLDMKFSKPGDFGSAFVTSNTKCLCLSYIYIYDQTMEIYSILLFIWRYLVLYLHDQTRYGKSVRLAMRGYRLVQV